MKGTLLLSLTVSKGTVGIQNFISAAQIILLQL